MTNKQIYALLDRARMANFLESIEILAKEEREYRRSEFHKTTRIPLKELFVFYSQHEQSKINILSQLEQVIDELDVSYLVERLEEFLVELGESGVVAKLLDGLLENIDVEQVGKYVDTIEKELKNLKG